MRFPATRTFLPFVLLLLAPGSALAQDAAPAKAPPDAFQKRSWNFVKATLMGSAEKMSEEGYGFRPVEGVRSFGQILGHAADSEYYFCSAVLGEKNPAPMIEKTKTTKADLIASLKAAFAYCDRAYDGLTDASAGETVNVFKSEMPKTDVLTTNTMHGVEHYGNLVVYLRMKGLVPPSSEPGFNPEAKK